MTSPAPAPATVAKSSPAPEPTAGARKSALLLHALAQADREWVMAQLPEGERSSLLELLADLKSLGIPADRGLVDEAVTVAREPEGSAFSARDAGSVRELAKADPARLAALLRDEPALLLAHLLRLNDWPWRAELRRHLGESKWREVEERRTNFTEAPALDAQVVESTLRHLRADSGPRPRDRVSGLLARLRGRWARP